MSDEQKILEASERPLTLKSLAKQITPSASEASLKRTMRQLRHWTQNDILRTMGGKDTGTGVPRVYPEEPTVLVAAFLLEIARYGATLEILKPAADELYDELNYDNDIFFATETGQSDAFAQISWKFDPDTGHCSEASIHFVHGLDVYEGDNPRFEAESTSSILVNLTALLWGLQRDAE